MRFGLDEVDGNLVVTALVGDHAEQMQAIGVVWSGDPWLLCIFTAPALYFVAPPHPCTCFGTRTWLTWIRIFAV
jgi:hypothetical protein